MEILVVVAIILVLAAITVPTVTTIQIRASKNVALQTMRQLAAAAQAYATDNDGLLPQEDAKGSDSWTGAASLDAKNAWYNVLPKMMGRHSVGDYVSKPREFYTKENVLFLPGATYPESDKKLAKPLFALAMNTKLQRREIDGTKRPLKLSQISQPARTVLFLEQGMPSEKKSSAVQSNKDFDGSPKGSAKSFPGRYGGKGVLAFLDGHVEEWAAKDLLTETGVFPFPATDVIWTRSPEEDPNK